MTQDNIVTSSEIDLKELFNIIIHGKVLITSISIATIFLGLLYSLLLPNIYQSNALLVPVDASGRMSSSLNQLGGLAGLSNINLPSSSTEGNSEKAIKKIKSLSFFENILLPKIHLPNLMALDSWNHKSNKLNYNRKIFDEDSNSWIRKYKYPLKQIPSAQESFEVFLNNHLQLNQDQETGFITLSIRHKSPYIAQEWSSLIVDEINSYYRQKDKQESERAVDYLNKQIALTSFSVIKEVIAELLQEETQKLTLIEANQFYVFEYIDPPAVMEQKSEPNRLLIVILSGFIGIFLSFTLLIFKHYFLEEKTV